MAKRINFKDFSTLLSISIGLVNIALAIVLYVVISKFGLGVLTIILGLIMIMLNVGVIKYILDNYLLGRIRLIYKLISATKLTSEEKKTLESESRSLADVTTDVEAWANQTNQELEQLKALEQYRKEYIGNVSHELKTPIFALQGYLHSLLDGGMYEEKINKLYIEKAAKNADRLSNIIDDLEAIHTLENEGSGPQGEVFEIKDLVDEVFDDLQRSAKKKEIELIYGDGAAAGLKVRASRDEINRVLVNLINNAIKYGTEGGSVKASFYVVQKAVLIEITDDGIGIEEKHLKHLFDRFYRVDSARSRAEGGSGLGLSLAKHIIESHGYTISVRSRPQIGSTFSFMLEQA